MKPVVLVVDDDTAICALLQDVLSEHVFTVSVCHTGQEAILRIEGDPDIALVVLDMMLPDTNGLRVFLRRDPHAALFWGLSPRPFRAVDHHPLAHARI